jgi:hypothetical protein
MPLLLCLFYASCLGIRPGGPAPAVDIAAIPPQELLQNPREPLPVGLSYRVAVGPVLVAKQSLPQMALISKPFSNQANVGTPDTPPCADVEEGQFCFDEKIQSTAQTAIKKILAQEPALQVVVLGEEACARLIGPERDEMLLSGLQDYRYYVDGNVTFDERIKLNRLNLNLYDMKTNQIIGTCTRAGADISEASALAAEGILWRMREDVRLFLLKEGTPPGEPPAQNLFKKLLFE